MTTHPLVSIIINNYNYGRFLGDAIESALRQTYRFVEVIVVDDGSTDHSQQVIQQYAGVVTALFQQNQGQAAAFNAGFAASHGNLVIFLDADDMLLPEIGQQIVNTYVANPLIAKIQYRMEVIDATGARIGKIKPDSRLPLQSGDLRYHALMFPFDMTWMATSANAFSAAVLRRIFPLPEKAYGHVGADWYLAHVTPLFGFVQSLNHVGALYRVHGMNQYEPTTSGLDLAHIRQTLLYAQITTSYIIAFAQQSGVPKSFIPREILSVSAVANRMVSFKLDRSHHPFHGDTSLLIMVQGVQAAFRRFDVTLTMRFLFCVWFIAIGVAHGQMAVLLARLFLIPETRRSANRILTRFHRTNVTTRHNSA